MGFEVEELFKQLAGSGSGALGVILAIMIWDNIKMKNKLFDVIENNTNAIRTFTERLNNIRGKDGG
jgi:hypothetical protein